MATTVAWALDRRPLFINSERLEALGPYLRLRGLLPVFCLELGPGEHKALPALPWYEGPVLALCGPEGQLEHVEGSLLTWALPVPTRQERQQLWQLALGNGALAEQLAGAHRHRSGRIAHLGRLARHYAATRGQPALEAKDIRAAAWSTEGGGLGSLAQPLPERIGDEVLVAGSALSAELQARAEPAGGAGRPVWWPHPQRGALRGGAGPPPRPESPRTRRQCCLTNTRAKRGGPTRSGNKLR